MAQKGFGSDLWKNVNAVRLKDGAIQVPVRAGSKTGIVAGVDAVASADKKARSAPASESPAPRSWWRRLIRR